MCLTNYVCIYLCMYVCMYLSIYLSHIIQLLSLLSSYRPKQGWVKTPKLISNMQAGVLGANRLVKIHLKNYWLIICVVRLTDTIAGDLTLVRK